MDSIDILEKLVAFPTVCGRPNIDLINFTRSTLAENGIESEIFPNETGDRANLFATVGPKDASGIILSGHTDVVSTEGQSWTFPPFEMTRADDRLFGRGTADMKGFVAAALAAALRAKNQSLTAPLHLAFSFDEEAGCLGVHSMLRELADRRKPRLCLVGEPTLMQVVVGHKGKMEARVTCVGRAAHSSLAPHAENAIYLGVEFIEAVRLEQQRLVAEGGRDEAYDLPYSTLHVGLIRGGRALNIVPDLCTLEFEIRHLPEDSPEQIMDRLREAASRISGRAREHTPEATVEIDITNYYPGLQTAPDSNAVQLVKTASGSSVVGKVAYGTEGGLFSDYLNVPTIVCGPGSITQAHKPDEYIEVSQIRRCDEMLDALVAQLSEAPPSLLCQSDS